MPRFSTPSSKPITIGDQYTLFKKSAKHPEVPVVDDTKVKVDEEDGKEEDGKEEDSAEEEDSVKEDDGNKEASGDKVGEKRHASSDLQGETNKKEKSAGGETAALPGESPALEGSSSEDGEGGDSVRTEREQDCTKQETDQACTSSSV